MQEYSRATQDWDWVQFDIDGAREATRVATGRVSALLRATALPTRRAHRLDWTIGETGAHLVVVARANAGYTLGSTEPVLELDRLQETNRARIDELPERDPAALADALDAAVEELLLATDGRSAVDVVPWHSRTQLPLGGMLGIVLAELLVHGRDMARAQRTRWRIEATDAVHIVRGGMAFGPLVIDRDLAAARPITYGLQCRGVPRSILRFDQGTLTISPDRGEQVECRVRLDPVTFTLVAFGRRSPLVAALQGRALSSGRRPLAAFRLPSYFKPS